MTPATASSRRSAGRPAEHPVERLVGDAVSDTVDASSFFRQQSAQLIVAILNRIAGMLFEQDNALELNVNS